MSKKYKIVKPVYLDFLTAQDQVTYSLTDGFVVVDGEKVTYISLDGKEHETINWAWVIEMELKNGNLVKI